MPAGEGSLAHRRHVPSRVIALDSLTDRLDLDEIFGRKAPLHVDLGCGDGSFLCAMAQRMPDKNFLGIERLLNRVRTSARKAAPLDNVRLLRMESSYAVRYLLPPESVERFYLLFPDPWPKRRPHRRRISLARFMPRSRKTGAFILRQTTLITLGKSKRSPIQIPVLQAAMLMSTYLRANLGSFSGSKARLFTGWDCERFRLCNSFALPNCLDETAVLLRPSRLGERV